MKLLIEAAAKKFEREHNARVWMVWHIAALTRAKKLPDMKRMMLTASTRPRQTWQEQLVVMQEWAARRNAWVAAREAQEKSNGR